MEFASWAFRYIGDCTLITSSSVWIFWDTSRFKERPELHGKKTQNQNQTKPPPWELSGNSWASVWENCELKEYVKSLCCAWRVWSFRWARGTAAVSYNVILLACDVQDELQFEKSCLALGSFLFARRVSLKETLETEHTCFLWRVQ